MNRVRISAWIAWNQYERERRRVDADEPTWRPSGPRTFLRKEAEDSFWARGESPSFKVMVGARAMILAEMEEDELGDGGLY